MTIRSSRPRGESAGGGSVRRVFLKISQNSMENTCAKVSFSIKLQAIPAPLLTKRDSGIGVFLWILRNF